MPVVGGGGGGGGAGVKVAVGVDESGELPAVSSVAGVPPLQAARVSASSRGTEDRALCETDMTLTPSRAFYRSMEGVWAEPDAITVRLRTLLASASPRRDLIAVLLPWSYRVGGITVFVPRSAVERVNPSVREALKLVLTGAVGKSETGTG